MIARLIITALCLLPTLSLATVYQWKDAQGQTHYGQEPPANVNATQMHLNATPATLSNQEKIQTYPKTEQKDKETEKKAQNKQPPDPKTIQAMATSCDRAKTFLHELESQPRIRLQAADGKVTALTDEQRTQEIEKAKESIKKYCGENK